MTVLSAILILAGTILLVRFLDKTLAEKMAELKNRTIASMESIVGREISYESVSPSILQYIEVRDLAIQGSEGGEKPLLSVSSLRITYSLFRLLFDADPARALKEVRIENSVVSFDSKTDGDIQKLLESITSSGGEGEGSLPIRFSGSNVTLRLSSGGRTFTLSKLYFTVDSQADFFNVDFHAEAEGSLAAGFNFRTSFAVQGKMGRRLDWSDLTIRLLSFSSSFASIGSQTFQLVWKDADLEVRKIQDRSPVDIRLKADLARGLFTLDVTADAFKPEGLIRFTGPLESYNAWVSAPFTASGSLTYQSSTGRLDYQAEGSAVLAGQLPVQDVTARVKIRGTEKRAVFQTLSLSSADSLVEFTGDISFPSLYPQGTIAVKNMNLAGVGPVNAAIAAERRNGGLEVKAETLDIGGVSFDLFAASLAADASGSQRFRITASFDGSSRDDLLEAEGVLKTGKAGALSSRITLTRIPAAPFAGLLAGGTGANGAIRDISGILSPFLLSAKLGFETDFKTYSLSGQALSLATRTEPRTQIVFSLAADNERLDVSDFLLQQPGLRMTGGFKSRQSADGGLSFDCTAAIADTPYSFAGKYSKALGLELTGSYGFALAVRTGSHGESVLSAKADRLPIPIAAGEQSVSFALEGEFPNGGEWRVSCPSLVFYDLPIPGAKSNTAYMSLAVTAKEIKASRIKFLDDTSMLEGKASISYSLHGGSSDADPLSGLTADITADLTSAASESYTVSAKMTRGGIDATVGFNALPMKRIGEFALAGELTGTLRLTGTLSDPSLDIEASLKKGRLGTDPIIISGGVKVDGDRIELKSLSAKYLSHTFAGTTGALLLDKGIFTVATRYAGDFFGDAVDSDVLLTGTTSPTQIQSFLSGFMTSETRGTISLANVTVNKKDVQSWKVSFGTQDSILYFDGGPSDTLHGSIDSKNAFVLLLEAPFPIVGKAEGRIIGDRIESTLKLEEVDMRVLNAVLKSPVISITSGTLSGELGISGPINDPDYTGRKIRLESGRLSCVYVSDTVGPFSTTLSFSGRNFSFPTVNTTAGDARVSASGTFTLDHWVPVSFIVNVRTEEDSTARVAAKFGTVKIEGRAAGSVRISGDERKTNLTGSITASDCQITIGRYTGGKFIPEEVPTFVSLTAQTGKRVEFQWPTTEYPLVRAVAKPGHSLAVTYRGDTGAYTVKGSVETQGGDVFYFDRSFVLKSGKIVFDETQSDFDPKLTVRAEVRERDLQTNTPVKIYLDADGKLSLFSPRFSSDPPKSDVEIMAMIGAPIMDRTGNQNLLQGTAMLALDPLSQFLILRPFEQKVRQLLGFDTFSLRTQIIPNFLAQKAFGVDVNPLDNTSLSLGKYIGNDLFGEIVMNLQSQPNASGVPQIEVAWEFNLELATPLFILNWNFAPRNWDKLFLPDNTISLNWRFSY